MMYQRIRDYVEQLFLNAPVNAKTIDLKEEIITNLNDRFNDLVSSGIDEQQAFERVIASIGDIDELIQSQTGPVDIQAVERENKRSAVMMATAIGLYIFALIPAILSDGFGVFENLGVMLMLLIASAATGLVIYSNSVRPKNGIFADAERRKRAFRLSLSISLYIVAIIPVLLFEMVGWNENFGLTVMFFIAIAATVILIYNSMTKPQYIKTEDTLVEDFKKSEFEKNYQHSPLQTIHTTVWVITVVLYLVISFVFMSWAFSWLIFIIASVINKIIRLCYELAK